MKKVTSITTFVFAFVVSLGVQAASLEEVCADLQSQVKEGDLVFVEIDSKLFDKVAKTQNHWSSHIGIAMKHEGEWVVAESTIPVSKMTPFCDFVDKGYNTRIAAKRFHRPLADEEIEDLQAEASKRLGIAYHLGFKLRSNRMFCSKFVNEVYDAALGVPVGEVQTFRELMDNTEHPEVIKFWRWWFFGAIPWKRETLTPATQFFDSNFYEVYSYEAPAQE